MSEFESVENYTEDLRRVADRVIDMSLTGRLTLPEGDDVFLPSNIVSSFHRVRIIASSYIRLRNCLHEAGRPEFVKVMAHKINECAALTQMGQAAYSESLKVDLEVVPIRVDIPDLISQGIVNYSENGKPYSESEICHLFAVAALFNLYLMQESLLVLEGDDGQAVMMRVAEVTGKLLCALDFFERASAYYYHNQLNESLDEANKKYQEEINQAINIDTLSQNNKKAAHAKNASNKMRRELVVAFMEEQTWGSKMVFAQAIEKRLNAECDKQKITYKEGNVVDYIITQVDRYFKDNPGEEKGKYFISLR